MVFGSDPFASELFSDLLHLQVEFLLTRQAEFDPEPRLDDLAVVAVSARQIKLKLPPRPDDTRAGKDDDANFLLDPLFGVQVYRIGKAEILDRSLHRRHGRSALRNGEYLHPPRREFFLDLLQILRSEEHTSELQS